MYRHIHMNAPSKRLWGKERWELTSRMFWALAPEAPEEEAANDKLACRSTSSPTRDPHRLSVVPLCVVLGSWDGVG
jgi:hypothetical protein